MSHLTITLSVTHRLVTNMVVVNLRFTYPWKFNAYLKKINKCKTHSFHEKTLKFDD